MVRKGTPPHHLEALHQPPTIPSSTHPHPQPRRRRPSTRPRGWHTAGCWTPACWRTTAWRRWRRTTRAARRTCRSRTSWACSGGGERVEWVCWRVMGSSCDQPCPGVGVGEPRCVGLPRCGGLRQGCSGAPHVSSSTHWGTWGGLVCPAVWCGALHCTVLCGALRSRGAVWVPLRVFSIDGDRPISGSVRNRHAAALPAQSCAIPPACSRLPRPPLPAPLHFTPGRRPGPPWRRRGTSWTWGRPPRGQSVAVVLVGVVVEAQRGMQRASSQQHEVVAPTAGRAAPTPATPQGRGPTAAAATRARPAAAPAATAVP